MQRPNGAPTRSEPSGVARSRHRPLRPALHVRSNYSGKINHVPDGNDSGRLNISGNNYGKLNHMSVVMTMHDILNHMAVVMTMDGKLNHMSVVMTMNGKLNHMAVVMS